MGSYEIRWKESTERDLGNDYKWRGKVWSRTVVQQLGEENKLIVGIWISAMIESISEGS